MCDSLMGDLYSGLDAVLHPASWLMKIVMIIRSTQYDQVTGPKKI